MTEKNNQLHTDQESETKQPNERGRCKDRAITKKEINNPDSRQRQKGTKEWRRESDSSHRESENKQTTRSASESNNKERIRSVRSSKKEESKQRLLITGVVSSEERKEETRN